MFAWISYVDWHLQFCYTGTYLMGKASWYHTLLKLSVYLLYYSIDFQKFSTMFFFVEQHYCIPLSSTTTVLKFVDIHLSLIVLTMHCIVHCIVLNHMIDFITVCKFSSSLVSLQVPFDWCLFQEFYVSYLTSKRDNTLSNRGRAY